MILLFLGGCLAGTIGGLLGVGGGVVLMPLLRFVVGLSPAHAAGTCIVAVFCTTAGGSFRHYRQGNLRLRPLIPIITAGTISTVAFSFLFRVLSQHEPWLDLGIGLVFTLIAGRMIVEGLPPHNRVSAESKTHDIGGNRLQQTTIGGLAGALPGLLGIGTGAILVPAFHYWLKASIKVAVATSLACFCTFALVSSLFKYGQGYVVLDIALPVSLGALLGANLGAILNKRFTPGLVKLLFGMMFIYVALKFILSFVRS